MATKPDDLEAVRQIASALEPFDIKDRERIIRWVREKLGMHTTSIEAPSGMPYQQSPSASGVGQAQGHQTLASAQPQGAHHTHAPKAANIKSFIESKNPSSDNQFAATVAYYYQFEAPDAERKDSINSNDLRDACRKSGRRRLPRPDRTLGHAETAGLLDKVERGQYRLNAVGENLVALVLPGDIDNSANRPRRGKGTKKNSGSTKRKSITVKSGPAKGKKANKK